MVQIQRKGFPFMVGEVEFFVSLANETLQQMLKMNDDIEQITEKFRAKYEEKLKEIDLQANVDAAKLAKINDAKKEYLTEAYDLLLGAGAFDRIYAYHPYVDDLEQTFPDVIKEYVSEVSKFQKQQQKREDKILADFKKKKRK